VLKRPNREQGTSLPLAKPAPKFRGFPELRSNVLYCPKQFFTVAIPNSSVNCIRIVSHMLRKTLGWVDENGEPLQERHEFSYREFQTEAGIVQSGLQKAVDEALNFSFIRRARKACLQTQGVQAKSAAYELLWDAYSYTDRVQQFQGFYLQPSYTDEAGQNRIGRKNIPNIFFDHLIKHENRALIRTVGTLLWYSIDWGKGGERRTTVRKSLRDLVELTQLAKGSVVRALDEAVEKDYIERVEPGVFDFAGNRSGSVTVYGINWTKDYTYTHDGVAVPLLERGGRSKNETRLVSSNASKMRHGTDGVTLQKRDTTIPAERSKNETRNASETRHEKRFKNETIQTTNTVIPNISINNNSTPRALPNNPAAEQALLTIGFDRKASKEISGGWSADVILHQIDLLPKRKPTKNLLGMLRRAIEENWADPEIRTTDVGKSLGRSFAASFYAGYHGNTQAPVSEPSIADSESAEKFVARLLHFWPDSSQAAGWGHQFGALVSHCHRHRKQNFPALRPAIQQHGDDFYLRLQTARETEKRQVVKQAQSFHFERFQGEYLNYLRATLARHQAENSQLFQAVLAREVKELKPLKNDEFGLNTKLTTKQYPTDRLELFQHLAMYEDGHDVLSFWQWDQELNEERYTEANA